MDRRCSNGKPYSAIAHLAEDITAVVAINRQLAARGYSAPRIEAFDLAQGFAVIEDLGRKVYGRMMLARRGHGASRCGSRRRSGRHGGARLAGQGDAAGRRGASAQRYDIEAQQIEVDLLPSWFWPYAFGRDIAPAQRQEFVAIWSRLLPLTQPEKPVWTLRDYHSPNLLWLPRAQGPAARRPHRHAGLRAGPPGL